MRNTILVIGDVAQKHWKEVRQTCEQRGITPTFVRVDPSDWLGWWHSDAVEDVMRIVDDNYNEEPLKLYGQRYAISQEEVLEIWSDCRQQAGRMGVNVWHLFRTTLLMEMLADFLHAPGTRSEDGSDVVAVLMGARISSLTESEHAVRSIQEMRWELPTRELRPSTLQFIVTTDDKLLV